MLPEYRQELARRLPDEMAYPYFRGREAAWLLCQLLDRPARIAALRRGPLAPLLDRPGVRETVRACGDGRLAPGRLLPLADPLATLEGRAAPAFDKAAEAAFAALCGSDIEPFIVTFDSWAEDDPADWRWNQTSRRGSNLVVQVNFPEAYGERFNAIFGPERRSWMEYWTHPVRQDGPITMGWARLDMDPDSDEVLIEEVQTDWLRTIRAHRKGLIRHARAQDEDTALLAGLFIEETAGRYGRIWAEAVLLAAIAVARGHLGARRIWLHQPHTGAKLKHIRDRLPPRSLYTDLPRRFCFRPTDRAPQLLYEARSQAVHRLRRSTRPVFWRLDLDAPAA